MQPGHASGGGGYSARAALSGAAAVKTVPGNIPLHRLGDGLVDGPLEDIEDSTVKKHPPCGHRAVDAVVIRDEPLAAAIGSIALLPDVAKEIVNAVLAEIGCPLVLQTGGGGGGEGVAISRHGLT